MALSNNDKIGFVYVSSDTSYADLSDSIKNSADSSILFISKDKEIYVGKTKFSSLYPKNEILRISHGDVNAKSAPARWHNGYDYVETHSSSTNRVIDRIWITTNIQWGDSESSEIYNPDTGFEGAFPRYINVAGESVGSSLSVSNAGVVSGLPVIGFDEWGVCDQLESVSVNLGSKLVTLGTAQTITGTKTFSNNSTNSGGKLCLSTENGITCIQLNGISESMIISTNKVNYSYINVPVSFGKSANLYFYNRGYVSDVDILYPEYATLKNNYLGIEINPSEPKISLRAGLSGTNAETIILNGSTGTGTYTGRVSSPEFYVSSDSRLKNNQVKLTDFSDDVNIYEYTWKDSPNEDKMYGFIAQEVSKNYPQFVESGASDEDYMTVNYNSAICLTLAKLYKKIEDLEKEIKELKK